MQEQNIYVHYDKIIKTIKTSVNHHHFAACHKMISNFSRLFKDKPRMASDLRYLIEIELNTRKDFIYKI